MISANEKLICLKHFFFPFKKTLVCEAKLSVIWKDKATFEFEIFSLMHNADCYCMYTADLL